MSSTTFGTRTTKRSTGPRATARLDPWTPGPRGLGLLELELELRVELRRDRLARQLAPLRLRCTPLDTTGEKISQQQKKLSIIDHKNAMVPETLLNTYTV